MATNPDVERGLRASVRVFDFATAELGKKQDAVTVDREQLVELKRAAAAMNRSITRFAKEAFATENRLVLEVHMLRGIMHRENTDRDANRARVFELFRRHSGGGNDGALAVSNAAAGTNPLTSPSSAAIAVDRALASLDRIEKGVRDLSPTGTLATHGAGLLSAKTTRDARLAATGKRART
jgi:hypothetical protein